MAKQQYFTTPVYRKQLSGWSPYRNRGGGRPPEPPLIGRAPLGGDNPRFPSVGPKEITPPPGGYQSIISTKAPIDPGRAKQIFKTPLPIPMGGMGQAASASFGAFSRALQDSTNSQLRDTVSEFNQNFVSQAQKDRAEDILSQRQNAGDAFRMEKANAVGATDIATGYDTGSKDLMQAYYTERWNQEAERTAILLRFLGSLF